MSSTGIFQASFSLLNLLLYFAERVVENSVRQTPATFLKDRRQSGIPALTPAFESDEISFAGTDFTPIRHYKKRKKRWKRNGEGRILECFFFCSLRFAPPFLFEKLQVSALLFSYFLSFLDKENPFLHYAPLLIKYFFLIFAFSFSFIKYFLFFFP